MRGTLGFIAAVATTALFAAETPAEDAGVEIERWWHSRTERFATSDTSPLAAVASFYLKPGERLALTPGATDAVKEPVAHGVVSTYQGTGFEVTIVNATEWSVVGVDPRPPSGAPFTLTGEGEVVRADGLVLVYSQQGRSGRVMLFQKGTAKQRHFTSFARYPVDLGYRVAVPLVRLKTPEPVTMGTSQGLVKEFLRVGYFDFDIAGQKLRLYAYQDDLKSPELFVPFKDANAGKDTYGAGRYIDLEVTKDDRYVVDFNLAYNPLCAVSPYYNCAKPPAENCVAAAIRAGEKAPPTH